MSSFHLVGDSRVSGKLLKYKLIAHIGYQNVKINSIGFLIMDGYQFVP